MKKLITLIVCLSAALALSACGGGGGSSDEAQIKSAIHELMLGASPGKCTSVETRAFREQRTQEAGEAALKTCEEDAEHPMGRRARSERVSRVKVDGARASAVVAVHGGDLGGQTIALTLVEEDGDWKVDSVKGFVTVDKAALAGVFEKEAAQAFGPGHDESVSCVGKAVEAVPKAVLTELMFGKKNSGAALKEFVEPCFTGAEGEKAEAEAVGASGAEGSGYSFGMPSGFAPATVEGEGAALPSLQAIATAAATHTGAGITVGEIPGIDATDEAELAALASRFERENEATVPKLGARASKVATTSVGGNLALRWKLTGTGGGPFPGTDAEVIAVFSPTGHNAAEVSCRWGHNAGEKQAIAAGCQSVLDTLELE